MMWVLGEAILMSTHNIGFYEGLKKIIFQFNVIASKSHLICSSDIYLTLFNLLDVIVVLPVPGHCLSITFNTQNQD